MHKARFWQALVIVASLTLLVSLVSAATITEYYQFPPPEISISGELSTVTVKGMDRAGKPGEPLLPARGLSILLPQGEEVVTVRAIARNEERITLRHPVRWARLPQPVGDEGAPQRSTKVAESAQVVRYRRSSVRRGASDCRPRCPPHAQFSPTPGLPVVVSNVTWSSPSEEELFRVQHSPRQIFKRHLTR